MVRRDQQEAPQAQEDAPAPTQALAAEEHIEHDVPNLKIGFLVKEPFSFCNATSNVTDGVTANSVEHDVPKLETEVQMVVAPFSFPINVPGLGIELRVETEPSSHRMATSITVDSVTASSPPTHPAQLSDGGGADVGGVESHQTQDTGTETRPVETTASQQTQDAGAGANATLAAGAGGPGWVTGEAGHGWVALDGTHWGATLPTERPPLKLANDKCREERLRHSNEVP
jgi:hypothetical protein